MVFDVESSTRIRVDQASGLDLYYRLRDLMAEMTGDNGTGATASEPIVITDGSEAGTSPLTDLDYLFTQSTPSD